MVFNSIQLKKCQQRQWFSVQQECMLVGIAQNTGVHHVHLAQKVLSKMATMGVNNALHVNIVMQVHFHFSSRYFTNPLIILQLSGFNTLMAK